MTSSNLGQSTKNAGKSTMTGAKKVGAASLAGSVIFGLLAFSGVAPASAAIVPTVPLATTADYSVLAGSTVTNTGPSVLNQNLGLNPGTSVTGFPPGLILGTTQVANGPALQAQDDLTNAFNSAASRPATAILTEQLAGQTLNGGVYSSQTGTMLLDGALTLDGENNPNSVFIFQSASTVITGAASQINLINGAQACNVFWQVGSSATLGAGSSFAGTILAETSITAGTGATVEGRALARNGAVTLDTNVFTMPGCDMTIPTPAPTATASPTATATATASPTATTPVVPPTATTPVVVPTSTATATTPVVTPSMTTTSTATSGTGTGTSTGTGTGVSTSTDTGTDTATNDSPATPLADTGVSSMNPLFANTAIMLLLAGLGLLLFGKSKTARQH